MPEERTPLQDVESFHLCFLRALETRLDRSSYVVKGGVNVRAWFGSPRYSEDLDLDVVTVRSQPLTERVDQVIAGPTLGLLLRGQRIELARVSKPKQTETTQRWKLELRSHRRELPMHTKVEFSRRGTSEAYVLEPVSAEVVRPYGIPAPTANHYTAAAAVRQKIGALVGRTETQARDIWDLDHLFRTAHADPRPLPPLLGRDLADAAERVMAMPYEAFMSQVVAYLDSDHHELYGTPEAWQRIQELVVDRLLGLAP